MSGAFRYLSFGSPHTAFIRLFGVYTPLVFELYDNWNGKAVAGCTITLPIPEDQIQQLCQSMPLRPRVDV